VAARLGLALGVAFGLCFATGVISHLIQDPPSWFEWPARPAGLYRVTQGLHVAAGIASIPLLLAKLWTVYPKLFAFPPFESVAHLLERISLLPLVAGSVFLLFSGVANIALWYPWEFFFPRAHFWAAWLTMGALIVHIGAKASKIRPNIRRRSVSSGPPEADDQSRRRFLWGVAATSGLITIATVGQTVRPLAGISVLAPRDPRQGPQGVPVNKSARQAGVIETAVDPSYRLTVRGNVANELTFDLDELRALPLRGARLPISCVEGWSAEADWEGISLPMLLDLAGAAPGASVRVESLQQRGLFRTSLINGRHARDRDTLLALSIDGEPLHIDHGFPIRLIGPNRPGVHQTKWVHEVVVL
jgi:DMSO/TMAO reductase YedYZ molybdopterin-dependent catalytic subunit